MNKKISFLMLMMLLCFIFAGCKKTADITDTEKAAKYVKSILDVTYQGETDAYSDLTGTSEKVLTNNYKDGLKIEAAFLAEYYGVKEADEESIKELSSLCKDMYKKSDYQIGNVTENNGSYHIEVIIKPVYLLQDCAQKTEEYMNRYNQELCDGVYDSMSETERNKEYLTGIIQILKENLSETTYGEPVTIDVELKKNDKGNYFVENSVLMDIDTIMIQYTSQQE